MMRLWTFARTFNPRWVITVLCIVVVLSNFVRDDWRTGRVLKGETERHYRVLPQVFYGNHPESSGEPHVAADVAIGSAVSYLPFFGLAHIAAIVSGSPADGYSGPYQFMILSSSLIYFVIGLIFLSKLLRLHFPGVVCSITLLVITFGTNALYYLTHGGGMPHALSFMLAVLFLYQVIAWHQLKDRASAIQLGLLLGALWLVRPVNAWLVIVFFLYDVRRLSEVAARMRLFARKWKQVLLIVACCVAVALPQLIFWKYLSGQNPGEALFDTSGYHFKRPHVLQGLFSFHHGWLTHAPVMMLGIAGFFFLRGSLRMYAWAIPVFLFVYIYILFSWWCWWYGASFGQRAMIDIYPLIAIPLGAFIYKLRRLGGAYKYVLYSVIMVLLAINIWRTFTITTPAEGEGICRTVVALPGCFRT